MKIGYFDKQTEQLTVYSCKSDLIRLINISDQTLLNWQGKGSIKETTKGIIYFNVEFSKAKKNVRRYSF